MSAPRVLAAVALSARTVVATFDQDVVTTATTSATLLAKTAPAVSPRVAAVSADGPITTVELAKEMTPAATYELALQGIENPAGEFASPPANVVTLRGFSPHRPESRAFNLWQMMPAYNRRHDATGDLKKFLACLQEVVDLLLSDLDAFPTVFDIERAPEAFVDLILEDLGNPFTFPLTLHEKRRLASVLTVMYAQKATDRGIENAIRFFLGTEAEVLPFQFQGLVLGESLLGIDWVLGPSDSFSRYAFDIEVDRILTGDEEQKIHAVVDFMKRAGTHFISIVQPIPIVPNDSWLIGQSELGVDTVLS